MGVGESVGASRRAAGIGLTVAVMLCAGCGGEYVRACTYHYRDISCDSTTTYRDITAAAASGFVARGSREMLVETVNPEDLSPIAGLSVRIQSTDEPVTLISNANGIVRVPLSPKLAEENPTVALDPARPVRTLFSYSRGQLLFATPTVGTITTEGCRRIDGDGYAVWYRKGCGSAAEAASSDMKRQRETVAKITGLTPISMGAVVVPSMNVFMNYAVGQQDFPGVVWCYSAKEIASGYFAAANVHEWTELTVATRLNLYEHDARNRWIGDGLAEYTRVISEGGVLSQDTYRPRKCIRKGVHQFDLLNAKPQDYIRYQMGLVFWKKLCDEHGQDLPAKFLARLKEEKTRDSDAAIRILEELTGDGRIREKLTKADVDEALKVLKTVGNAPKAKGKATG